MPAVSPRLLVVAALAAVAAVQLRGPLRLPRVRVAPVVRESAPQHA